MREAGARRQEPPDGVSCLRTACVVCVVGERSAALALRLTQGIWAEVTILQHTADARGADLVTRQAYGHTAY